MTRETDDFLIELDDEPRSEAAPKRAAEKEPVAERDPAADEAIEAMRRQLKAMEDERTVLVQGKAEAERVARENAELANRANGQAMRSHYDMVQGHISAATNALSSIKEQMRIARASGDFDSETDLQSKFVKAQARLLQYEDEKADLEARAQQARERPEPARAEPQQRPSDPFEAYVQTVSPASQNWLRQHRECVTDPEQNAKVIWGHQQALKRGLKADTPEYFSYLEDHMGYSTKRKSVEADEPETDDGDEVEIIEAKPEPRRSVPAAPVTRGSSTPGMPNGSKVRLTRAQVEMAEAMGMTPTEYAKSLVQLTKAGRYPNVYN